jgi:hypothetical protein
MKGANLKANDDEKQLHHPRRFQQHHKPDAHPPLALLDYAQKSWLAQ